MSVEIAAAAQKSAVTAMRLVDQPFAAAVVEWGSCLLVLEICAMVAPRFSHPDYTVGPGIPPGQPLARVADFGFAVTASGEFHPALKLTPAL